MTSGVLCEAVDRLLALRARRRRGPRSGVLLVASGGLGDVILFSIVVDRFRRLAAADERIRVVVRRGNEAAQFLFPQDIDLIPVDYRRFVRDPLYRWRVGHDLGGIGCRVAVATDHLRLPTVDDVLVMATGAPETFALEPRAWPKHDALLAAHAGWYTRLVTPSSGMAHRAARWTELLNGLTGRDDPPPVVRFDSARLPPRHAMRGPTVVLHPVASQAERQHPVALFEAILDSLPAGHQALLSAGPGDLDRAPEYRRLLDRANVRIDESELWSKAAVLRGAKLVVSVDTSILHLAVGVGAPTVALASAAHVVDSVPYDARMMPGNVEFLYHDMPCRMCLGACVHPLEDGRFPCVARLERDRVLAAVAARLAR